MTDNKVMGSCGFCLEPIGRGFASLSRAAAKAASARIRRLRDGESAAGWTLRAEACERCPMRKVYRNVSYCGSPFLRKPLRDPAEDGCGCPTIEKAKDRSEHCPLTVRHRPATRMGEVCDCKWCGQ